MDDANRVHVWGRGGSLSALVEPFPYGYRARCLNCAASKGFFTLAEGLRWLADHQCDLRADSDG